MTKDEFNRMWNSWDINQRIDWLKFTHQEGQTDKVVRDYVKQQYGSMAAYLDNKEVGPILMRAGREGWTPERLAATIQNTKWWKTHAASEREWELLKKTDKATAKQKIDQAKASINALLAREGVTGQLSDSRISALAEKILKSGADPSMVPKMVLAEIRYNPTHPVGLMGERMATFQKRARDYAINLGDETAFDWAKRVAMGDAEEGGFDEYARQAAERRFSRNATILEQLKEGYTVREVLDDPIQEVARLMEVDPDSVDLSRTEWSPIAEFADDQGNVRAMTAAEAGRWARTQTGWQTTANANDTESKFAQFLGEKMGKVAAA
jgi:hypothetical protein